MSTWFDDLFTAKRARVALKEHRKEQELALPYLDVIAGRARDGHSDAIFHKQNGIEPHIVAHVLKSLGYYANFNAREGKLLVDWREEMK